jgi:adenylate cyclase
MTGIPGIQCATCGRENPDGSRFCGYCGESLTRAMTCPSCGTELPADARFCLQCGAPVDAAAPEPAPPDGERKQITVLFADVRGSMDLAERLDAESWRAVMQRFFDVLAEAVERADGTVDKFTGDGIMALFGAPVAREDHALCACRAALDMIRSVDALATELEADGIDLAVRIGINSGEVVVGSISEGGMEYTAFGHTVGLAQRMVAQAEVGTAYLTGTTAALAEGFFELTDCGVRTVKGASEPLRVYRLDGVGSAHGHLDVSRARGLTPFIGRADELAELEAAYARATAGAGEVVGVVAPAGVGKSRLCHELAERCRERGIGVYQAQCEAHTRDIPLVPVLQLLRSRFGISGVDSDTAAQAKIRSELADMGAGSKEDVALVLDFLGVPDPDAPTVTMNGDARNRRLRELVRRLVQAQAGEPSVIVLEDLQWIDEASALFLDTLVEAVSMSGGLIVANFRPEYRTAWMGGTHYRQLPLSPLSDASLSVLIRELLGDDPSLDGLIELVAERTEGNPFYAEEVVRELAESGTLDGDRGAYRMAREIDQLPVPPTVQTILAARIDRLPSDAKTTLQAAATIGSEASRALLGQVVSLSEDRLDDALRTLVTNEFIHETSLYPEQVYGFRHRLTQEVAYGSLLAAARERTHLAVAVGLQTTDPDRLDENAGLIAQHFAQAGGALQAAQWHLRAVSWSGLRDPMASIRHAMRVVDLDRELPDGPEADAIRLMARLYVTTMGWRVGADTTVIRTAFDDGVLIAERTDDDTMLTLLHVSFASCPLTCEGRLAETQWIAAEGQRRADALGDRGLMALARVIPIYCQWLEGNVATVVELCDELAELTAAGVEIPFADSAIDPRSWAEFARGPSLLAMGRAEEAHACAARGIELAAEVGGEVLGWAHMFAATFHTFDPDLPIADLVGHARTSAEIADRLGDVFSQAWARFWTAYAALREGSYEEAFAGFTQALEQINLRGAGRESEALIRYGIGATLAATGRVDEGIEAVRESVDLAVEQGIGINELWTREAIAGWLMDRAGPGDLEEAAEHLAVAADFAQRTGNVVYVERIGELRRRLPATTEAWSADGSVTGIWQTKSRHT